MWSSVRGLSSLVGASIAIEKTLAWVFESTPVHGDLPPTCGSVKLRLPRVSNRFLMPSKSKKNASERLPAKNVHAPHFMMFGCGPKETSPPAMILVPAASAERD